MKRLLYLFIMASSFGVMANDIGAPFGFEWGQSYHEINKKVPLTDCATKNNLMLCETTKPIQKVSFSERYIVVIDNKHGLQKVILVSQNISGDISGEEGKALYSKVKQSLTQKYNSPHTDEYLAKKTSKDHDEFYKCLKSDECGNWVSFWQAEDGSSALVELKGLSSGKGYLMLTYQSNKWQQIINVISKEEKKSDHDAL
ncbi:hypothetical protein [Photobacterium kishitanii]|uniref:hypothetical protein n=2 Tax=Photobacterium kishitanii TaxID=318456 RepID=UPI0004342D07|nr:hypothetical protein [Photobacterium kishitanii]CEO40970.1 conserved exported hypothetical protein [Photobacterium kishitanii]